MKTGRYNKSKTGSGREENRRSGKPAPTAKRRSQAEGKDEFRAEGKSDKPRFEKRVLEEVMLIRNPKQVLIAPINIAPSPVLSGKKAEGVEDRHQL